jgi:hypothetical protein
MLGRNSQRFYKILQKFKRMEITTLEGTLPPQNRLINIIQIGYTPIHFEAGF